VLGRVLSLRYRGDVAKVHMIRHELKTWVSLFSAVRDGTKTFDVRKNDRDFSVGDELLLREYHHVTHTYTGRKLLVGVTYVYTGPGVVFGHCVLAIKKKDLV
jgi:hypothetical protein